MMPEPIIAGAAMLLFFGMMCILTIIIPA